MINFLLAPFVAIGVMLGSLFAPVQEPTLGASEAIPTTIAFFETTLASAISSTATTFTLTSATDKDGTTLASSTYAFVIDEGSSNEEIVIADCTSTACTNTVRGVSVLTGTSSVAALKKSHRRGASIKITDAPILMILSRIMRGIQDVPDTLTYDGTETIATSSSDIVYASWVNSNYGDLFNGNTWVGNQSVTGELSATGALWGSSTAQFTGTTTGYAGFLTSVLGQCGVGSPNTQLCDKAYIDGVAVAGASDANETTKGIVEEATSAEVTAMTATGGTGAKLFVTPAKLGDAFTLFGTTTPDAYSNATTSFTVASGKQFVVYASGVCTDPDGVNGGAPYASAGIVSLVIDNTTVRRVSNVGVYSTAKATGIPFSLTYASSSPSQTTVDVLLTSTGDGCSGTLEDVAIDYVIFP